MNLRIVIGLAVSVSLQMLLGLLAGALFPPVPSGMAPTTTAVQAALIALIASAAGAFAARQPFLRAALVLWAVGWMSSLLVMQRLAGPQFGTGAILAAHALPLVASGIATVIGVRAGRRLDRRLRGDAADASG